MAASDLPSGSSPRLVHRAGAPDTAGPLDGSLDGPLGRLALARGHLERRAERRTDPDLVQQLRRDPTTMAVRLVGPRALVVGEGTATRLALSPAVELADAPDRIWIYLGQDDTGTEHLLAADPRPAESPDPAQPQAVPQPQSVPQPQTERQAHVDPGEPRLAGLREIGALLDDTGVALVTGAVALANWHATHIRCPRCGAPTEPVNAGWVRRCTSDGSDHYPRTDPAVIVTVTDVDDRVLLGRSPAWPERRFSTLAGFVEPGESIEDAVRREVAEETGVVVGPVRYLGSQPWPFPASLILGCTGVALEPAIRVDGVEISEARWFSRQELAADAGAGRVLLPSTVSIARRLLEHWYGGPLPTEGTWR